MEEIELSLDPLLTFAEPFTTDYEGCDRLAIREPFQENVVDSVIYRSSQTVSIQETYLTAKKFKPEDLVSRLTQYYM